MVGVIRTLGLWLALLGVLTLPFAISASIWSPPHQTAFWLTVAIMLFLGAAFYLITLGRTARVGVRASLIFLLTAWVVTPLAAMVPFSAALPQASLLQLYFEAVSALTTTGFKPAFAGESGHAIIAVWWNYLQWIGGAANISAALVVLAALNLTGPGVHRSVLFTLKRENVLTRLQFTIRIAFTLYGAVSICVLVVALASGTPSLDALCITFSSIATGGLLLTGGQTNAAAIPLAALVAASVAMVIGATNFALHWEATRSGRLATYLKDEEARFFMVLMLIAGLASLLLGSYSPQDAGRALLSGISLATSSGWSMGPVAVAAIPLPLILMFAFIGGSPVSTAGGLKVVRLAILFRHVGSELRLLAHPSSVGGVKFRDRRLAQRSVMGLLLYVIAFTALIGFVSVGVALGGAELPVALAAATGAVGNLGPALYFVAPGEAPVLLADPIVQAFLICGMIAGRMEILALLAFLLPAFWQD
jgi:trk system potassium uptake protein